MPRIEILDQQTIDKIAAGEVVERPASVVKELVENAIDAQATAVTVEIKEGGISFIRITDNGCGIEKDQAPLAFLRHSTSKIRSVEDLVTVSSLGFRGEALSSIASIAQVELITKTSQGISGIRYVIEGGKEQSLEEIGAPEGTTFLVRNLFYNTPARRKFLKTPQTEAGYIGDLMERMALSHPEISFKFIVNNQVKLHTSGNSNLKEIIYHIYGRDIAGNLLEIKREFEDFSLEGYLGKPLISRGNRNFENYFINGRYVKSSLIAKGIEDGYKSFVMQHKYPFVVLHLSIRGELLDVNVHPTKMELRFRNQEQIYEEISRSIRETINQGELVYQVELAQEKSGKDPAKEKKHAAEAKKAAAEAARKIPEPFEKERLKSVREAIRKDSPYEKKYPDMVSGNASMPDPEKPLNSQLEAGRANYRQGELSALLLQEEEGPYEIKKEAKKETAGSLGALGGNDPKTQAAKPAESQGPTESQASAPASSRKLLEKDSLPYHKIIGQLFDTYWLVQFDDKLYIIDQHAAHEKVLYERLMASLAVKEYGSQAIFPPMLLSLSMQEEELLKKYQEYFTKIGYEIEHFGGREYAVTAVPSNFFGLNEQSLMIEMLDSLMQLRGSEPPALVLEKIASMSCKAAVKGNQRLSRPEMEALIEELLTLENPYHCPHGRPTIISMSKYELEKKFKRVL